MYGGIVIVLVGNSITTVLLGAACIPRDGEDWVIGIGSHRCQKRGLDIILASGFLNAITDFYVLWIPLPLIWNLNLPIRKKIGLVLIFMQGLLYDT